MTAKPILYSFRRCPYAMRARLAIWCAGIQLELREVVLRNKPTELLQISDDATVPVLVLPSVTGVEPVAVIQESWDIMLWVLRQHDPDNWLGADEQTLAAAQIWLDENDSSFKHWLDRYKYADRFPERSQTEYRDEACHFLQKIEDGLASNAYLLGDSISIADMALLPFIRQLAFVDKAWFEQSPYPKLKKWLDDFLNTPLFARIMFKYPAWQPNDVALIVPEGAME